MDQDDKRGRKSLLWLWIVAACVIHVGAWTAWFIIAGAPGHRGRALNPWNWRL